MKTNLKIFILIFFLSSLIIQSRAQRADFYREYISIEISDSAVMINGIYYFRNVHDTPLQSNLFYPFPKDSTYGEISDVFAFEMNDSAKNVLVSHNQRLAALKLNIPPNAEKKLNIGYTQKISGNHAEYIVTTTQKWKKPIELAQFELIVPDHFVIDGLKYIPHDTSARNNKVHYYFSEEAFFPEEEFEVYFHEKEF